jgi:spore coat polysaccharide biosynthesis protein SpsF
MTGIVLQARMGSTRLSGKALLPLGGATLTDQVMRRLNAVPVDIRVLATDEASAHFLKPVAERCGFELLVGPAEDVLARYCMAIRLYGIDLAIRATGDNPLVSMELAILLLERYAESPRQARADYSVFIGMPMGMGVELVAAEALLRAETEARLVPEREHVCPYLYGHPGFFRIERYEVPSAFRMAEGRVTVDTDSDYRHVLSLYGALYDGSPIPTEAVLAWLRFGPVSGEWSRNP